MALSPGLAEIDPGGQDAIPGELAVWSGLTRRQGGEALELVHGPSVDGVCNRVHPLVVNVVVLKVEVLKRWHDTLVEGTKDGGAALAVDSIAL